MRRKKRRDCVGRLKRFLPWCCEASDIRPEEPVSLIVGRQSRARGAAFSEYSPKQMLTDEPPALTLLEQHELFSSGESRPDNVPQKWWRNK